MLRRIEPDAFYNDKPCSIVALSYAVGTFIDVDTSHTDGWMTLKDMNKYVRAFCNVKKRVDYKRGQRPKLKDITFTTRAIVMCYGHSVYVDGNIYYSFFDNLDDDVVTIWYLED